MLRTRIVAIGLLLATGGCDTLEELVGPRGRLLPRSVALPRKLSLIAAMLLLSVGAGCPGDSGTEPDDEPIEGTYTLRSVNNLSLPAVVNQTATERVEAVEGSLTLRSDMTFSVRFVERTTRGGVVSTRTDTPSGTYVVSGTRITLTEGGDTVEGTIHSANRITVNVEDFGRMNLLSFER